MAGLWGLLLGLGGRRDGVQDEGYWRIPPPTGESAGMETSIHESPTLEFAILRRGVDEREARHEECGGCGRTPLIGEQMYVYERDLILCELCRSRRRDAPIDALTIHGEEFGHTLRVVDQRAA